MNVNNLDIEGTKLHDLILIKYRRYEDPRGLNAFPFVQPELESVLGHEVKIVQINRTVTHQGIVRGIHWNPWGKLVWVERGEVYVTIVEGRKGDNFSSHVSMVLNEGDQLWVPEGCGNSFQSISQGDSVYYYGVTGLWRPEDKHLYYGAHAESPELAIQWLLPVVLGEEDQKLPGFKEFEPIELARKEI